MRRCRAPPAGTAVPTFNFPHFARRNQAPIIYTGADSSITDPPQTVRKRAFFNALAVLMNSFSNEIARRFAISFQK